MKKILIIKLDAIGDYVLFRNFLKEIRKKHKKDKIFLLGNSLWKDLAEKYDSKFIDEFFWTKKEDIGLIKSNIKKLNQKKVDVLIQPTDSREILMHKVASKIRAKEKITFYMNRKGKQRKELNKIYNKFIRAPDIHEFDRYKKFFENFLDTKLTTSLQIPFKDEQTTKENYAVVFPSASSNLKRWPIKNFAKVSEKLKKKYNLNIIICGSKNDSALAEKIQKRLPFKAINMTGKSLALLPEIIGNAKILITNDTAAAHIGASTKTNSIVVGTGILYGRFLPYPKKYSWVKTVLPRFYLRRVHGPIFTNKKKKVLQEVDNMLCE